MEKSSSRLKVLALLVAVMFAALGTRLWFLQVLATEQFQVEADNNRTRIVESDALRGDIRSADHKTLVTNRLSLEVRVDLQTLEASGRTDAVLKQLSELLKIPVSELRARINDPRYYPFQPKPVAEFVKQTVYDYISERQSEFPGVQVAKAYVRDYPLGSEAAHVLGYLGQIQKEQLNSPQYKGYGQSDLVGRAGLELQYERYLRGTNGEQKFIVNANGDTIRALGAIPPTPGDTLDLTIDSKVQKAVEDELVRGLENARNQVDEAGGKGLYLQAPAGAAVVMDVQTGGVVAMASWPTYDPSWFVKGLTPDESRYLFKSAQAPSINRTIGLTYKPGSIFKPIVALTAEKEGVASFNNAYDCPATWTAPGDTSGAVFTNWSSTGLGYMYVNHALEISCDTVFYQFGYDFWARWRENSFGTNNEPFQRDLRQWGFNKPTGVDLPAEESGVIPDAQFAADHPDVYPDGWIPGGDILLSIGSGDTLVTPLQMAAAYSAIANGGHLCRPHVVDKIVDAHRDVVKTVGGHCDTKLPYTDAQLQYIRSALATVPTGGTASTAFSGFPLSTYPIAGKTGTAERPPFQSTSWFASFAPAGNPKYAVVVMVEQGGYGSQTAAPIARHIYEHLFGLTVSGNVNGGLQD
jgi:penicillin-binding protein 2